MKSLVLFLSCLVAIASGCSTIERLKVKKQWVLAFGQSEERENFGIKLWAAIFQFAPDARALFSRVKGDNEFSDEFQAHSARVMSGLDMCISLLDEEDILNAELAHLKMQHDDRGIPAENFGVFKKSLGRVLAQSLGHNFAKAAWDSCFDVISAGIIG